MLLTRRPAAEQPVRPDSKLGALTLGFGIGIGAILLSPVPSLGGAIALTAIIIGVAALKLKNVNRTHSKVGIWLSVIAILVQLLMLFSVLSAYNEITDSGEVESAPAVSVEPSPAP